VGRTQLICDGRPALQGSQAFEQRLEVKRVGRG
jgi:hypothetical protein